MSLADAVDTVGKALTITLHDGATFAGLEPGIDTTMSQKGSNLRLASHRLGEPCRRQALDVEEETLAGGVLPAHRVEGGAYLCHA